MAGVSNIFSQAKSLYPR